VAGPGGEEEEVAMPNVRFVLATRDKTGKLKPEAALVDLGRWSAVFFERICSPASKLGEDRW